MLKSNRWALKEWAVIMHALASGRQVFILRKGGVLDEGGAFSIQHREFFLYPTFEHQHRKYVRPEFHKEFDDAIREQPAGEALAISSYALLRGCAVVKDLNKLFRLRDFHVWTDEYLRMRFEYKPELPLYVLLLRAYRTPPVRVPLRPEYAGCKSWVEFDRELSVNKPRLALPYAEFDRRQHKIAKLLELPEATPVPGEADLAMGRSNALGNWGIVTAALEFGASILFDSYDLS